MITAEVQIHGYRKGHQLLASTVTLSKEDQTVVDRLSDVTGPLRPNEKFLPYLSIYPLPSGTYCVIARTWQDLAVSRAGCVRTKSILVYMQAWVYKPLLSSVLRELSSADLPTEMDAVRVELEEQHEKLPKAQDFTANELVEALFLEDVKPVVVFDAADPELIVSRLITALWPDIRSRFSLSTFALSPRKINGRDLDLVFAPSSAKGKFSDWLGRRVDGHSAQSPRHRWTSTIVRRVFEEPIPRLLSEKEVHLLADHDAGSRDSLRIALLWEELLVKLHLMPTAALGLLDIISSGRVNKAVAEKSLGYRLYDTIRMAADSLPLNDAWDFVGAIARKIHGHLMPTGKLALALESLVSQLAERIPDGVISMLQKPDPSGAISNLLPSIALGLGKGAAPSVEQTLVNAPVDIIARLLLVEGPLTLAIRIVKDDALIPRLGTVLTEVDPELANKIGMKILPYLIEDRQLAAAKPIICGLDLPQIIEEFHWLEEVNNFQAEEISAALIDRARELKGLPAVRDTLISSVKSEKRDKLLARTIDAVKADVRWLLDEKRLSISTITALLTGVMRRADNKQFAKLISDREIGTRILSSLPEEATDILERASLQGNLPIDSYVCVIRSLIIKVDITKKIEIARLAVERCLRNRFDNDEYVVLVMLLDTLGERIDGQQIIKIGLDRDIGAYVASRNMVVFNMVSPSARKRIVEAIDEIAIALYKRKVLDLSEVAFDACAKLMFDAEKTSAVVSLVAASRLLPSLFRAYRQPVSLIIAALFPLIYLELSRGGEVPDFLKSASLFDWDHCKSARRELVKSFMSSSWHPSDLALTACRCGDLNSVLKSVVKADGGKEYLKKIEKDISRLNDNDQLLAKRTIAEIKASKSAKFYW